MMVCSVAVECATVWCSDMQAAAWRRVLRGCCPARSMFCCLALCAVCSVLGLHTGGEAGERASSEGERGEWRASGRLFAVAQGERRQSREKKKLIAVSGSLYWALQGRGAARDCRGPDSPGARDRNAGGVAGTEARCVCCAGGVTGQRCLCSRYVSAAGRRE